MFNMCLKINVFFLMCKAVNDLKRTFTCSVFSLFLESC